ncbi:hypothetical protein EYQ95_11280 [Lysobacter sp. N42]|nr:AAA family ATPase [Aliidiomarina sp. B3213]RTE85493.1 hypothetical protein DQX04_11360 [Aliidiomarina sp. B3213]TCZ89461.1 hypothetical protein EYQ95_11280 [Lysobacter sp. N42]
MQYIKKLKLFNFKRFRKFEVEFSSETNTIIGDNESGKSSILQAIERVARTGKRAGSKFLGCASYPKCKFTRSA